MNKQLRIISISKNQKENRAEAYRLWQKKREELIKIIPLAIVYIVRAVEASILKKVVGKITQEEISLGLVSNALQLMETT